MVKYMYVIFFVEECKDGFYSVKEMYSEHFNSEKELEKYLKKEFSKANVVEKYVGSFESTFDYSVRVVYYH